MRARLRAESRLARPLTCPSRPLPAVPPARRETQTPEDQWNVGPGEQANSAEALANGAVRGQVHFFPAIADVATLKAGFESHGCAKL